MIQNVTIIVVFMSITPIVVAFEWITSAFKTNKQLVFVRNPVIKTHTCDRLGTSVFLKISLLWFCCVCDNRAR